MTYGELFTQVISEVTGKPKDQLLEFLTYFRAIIPGGNFDKQIDPDKAQALLDEIRRHPEAIKAWLKGFYSKSPE